MEDNTEKPVPRIAVTGAEGFIGASLCEHLRKHGYGVRAFGRASSPGGIKLDDAAGWRAGLSGMDAVIHLAGRAHVMRESAADPLAEFRRVNVRGTMCVAEAAASAGVKRFVFVSSIGVLGNQTGAHPFSEASIPAPVEAYAVSKHEAEQELRRAERALGLEVVIVRPPLVYGPHVKGNFLRLLRLVRSGVPLPLASIENRRSFVGVRNLSELLRLAAVGSVGHSRLFVAADGEDISTPQLLRLFARYLGVPNRQFPFPPSLLRLLAAAGGHRAEYRGLAGNLQVDASLARSQFGWRPTTPLAEGMREMVESFRQDSRRPWAG